MGLQSLLYQTVPRTVEDLVNKVVKAYIEYEPRKFDDNFLTIYKAMEYFMKVYVGNNHKMLHISNEHHLFIGKPISKVMFHAATYNPAVKTLNESCS